MSIFLDQYHSRHSVQDDVHTVKWNVHYRAVLFLFFPFLCLNFLCVYGHHPLSSSSTFSIFNISYVIFAALFAKHNT